MSIILLNEDCIKGMKRYKYWMLPILKGICITILLAALGLQIDNYRWWIAMGTLNILTQI
jgi:hypothetical protein